MGIPHGRLTANTLSFRLKRHDKHRDRNIYVSGRRWGEPSKTHQKSRRMIVIPHGLPMVKRIAYSSSKGNTRRV